MTPAELDKLHAYVARVRAEQGLPPTVEDEQVLRRVARIIARPGLRRGGPVGGEKKDKVE